jgi:hypothetical protein
MSQPTTSQADTADPRWKDLYRLGAMAAIAFLVIIVGAAMAYPIWPYLPGTTSTEAVFQVLQSDRLGGLLALDVLLIASNVLGIVFFITLYVALRQVNPSYALIALVVGLCGAVMIFPARPIVELISLSDRHAVATSATEKAQYLAAGEALLAQFNGTAFHANTFLGALSLLISSLLMLRSGAFGKARAYVGIATNLAVCLFFLPVVGMYLLFLSLPGYLVWYVQLARSFFRLARPLPAYDWSKRGS